MENKVYSKMFLWLFIGLLVTFLSGFYLSINEMLLIKVLSVGLLPLAIIEIAIAIFMGVRLRKMSSLTLKVCYILYSLITGITFSTIFIAFEMSSIISVFLVSAIVFACLAIYGYITKKDITKLGNILFAALLGVILISVINIFIGSDTVSLVGSILSLLVFMGYVVYDMNSVKYLMNSLEEDKVAVYGAFQLYLDFINIFIRLLEFFGKRKD